MSKPAEDETSYAASDTAVSADESSDASEGNLDSGNLRFGGGWLDRRGAKRALYAVLASMVVHAALFLVVLWLGLLGTEVEMEIEWSDDPIQGIGDAATVATTTAVLPPDTPLALSATTQPAPDDTPAPAEPDPEQKEAADPEPAPTATAEPAPQDAPTVEPDPIDEPPQPPAPDLRAEVLAVPSDAPDTLAAEDSPPPPPRPRRPRRPAPEVAVESAPGDTPPDEPVQVAAAEPTESPDDAPPVDESEPVVMAAEPEHEPTEADEPPPVVEVAEAEPEPEGVPSEEAQSIEAALLEGSEAVGAPEQGERDQRGHVAQALPGLAQFGPGNARLIVLVRNDRLRGTEYEESVRTLLSRFPHWQISLGKSGIDPMESLDAVLIATPNPTRIADTFLAARHRVDEKIFKLAVKHSYPVEVTWEEHAGRPLARPVAKPDRGMPFAEVMDQVVYLPSEGLALYLKPTLLETLHQPVLDESSAENIDPLADAVAAAAAPEAVDPVTGEPLAQRSLLETLSAIEEVDADGLSPAVFVSLRGIRALRFGRKLPELPAPVALDGSVTPGESTTRLVLRLEFADEETAQAFEEAWPGFVDAVGGLMIPGLGGMAKAIEIERRGHQVFADGALNTAFVKLLIGFAASSLPEVESTASLSAP